MKKIILLALSILIFTGVAIAQEATYVSHVKAAVLQELQKYFRVEVGNRVTEYNFGALVGRIGDIFKKFEKAERDSLRDAKKIEKDTPTDMHK